MKKRKLFPVVLVALLGLAFTSVPAGAHPAGQEHLPDLQTLKPSEIRISQSCTLILLLDCKRQLRFSNIVGNYGHGRLEMRPENNIATASTTAHQRIYSHDAAGKWYLKRENAVGEFAFHPRHAHWHFEAFADYRLITAQQSDTTIVGREVRSSQKVTFCIIDTTWLGTTLEHAGSRTYTRCGPTDVTGLTVGWGDRYGYNLSGQELDLEGVDDGFYWLKSTADPDGRLEETNESNNCAAAKIEISGSRVIDHGQRIPC